MPNLGINKGIDAIRDRRARGGLGMREAVGVPPIRDGRSLGSIEGGVDLELLVFVVFVVHILRHLVEVLLQVGNRAPHRSKTLAANI